MVHIPPHPYKQLTTHKISSLPKYTTACLVLQKSPTQNLISPFQTYLFHLNKNSKQSYSPFPSFKLKMTDSGTFLRQLSEKEGWKSRSKRWGGKRRTGYKTGFAEMEGMNNMYSGSGGEDGRNGGGFVMRKRVMVVVDQTSHSKHAMMWALTHVTNKGDLLTLLHIIPPNSSDSSANSPYVATSLGSLCKACKPEVEVEALVIQGPKMSTIMSQVKKLEVSVLVLGQKKSSSFFSCMCMTEDLVEECINTADCLTIGVKKQSQGMGGYLISTRWQKNFWLLA